MKSSWQKGLNKEIRRIVEILREKYRPSSILLFGSAVRGNFREGSDLDFFIVKETEKPRQERIREVYRLLSEVNLRYPCDFIVYTPLELKGRFALGDFFVRDILSEGKEVYAEKKS